MTWSPRLRAALWWWGIGYAAYYLCRTTFPVVRPVLIEELVSSGMSVDRARASVGWVVSISLMAAAAGKLAAGVFIDRKSGRGTYFWGGAGVALSTVLFTLGGPGWWAFSWSGHRLAQTLGWPSLMRSVAWLVPRERTGWVVALLSLSWLIGDAAARATHGALLAAGMSWQWVMRVAAGVLLGVMLWIRWRHPCEVSVRDEAGAPSPGGANEEPLSVSELVLPLLGQPAFWFAALASVSFTTLREGALEWGPTWLVEHGGMGKASAAASSAWFPLGGAVSALLAGRLGDGRGGGAKG
ncbi:MAG: MFS transporter, partial [Armatimonadaceae bacterium]